MKPIIFLSLLLASWLIQVQVFATDANVNDHAHSDHVHGKDDATHVKQVHSKAENQVEHVNHGEHSDASGHVEEKSTRIDERMSAEVGIKTTRAVDRVLRQSIVVYGSLTTDPGQLSHVRARYSGLIKSVRYTVGDIVEQGDLLVEVESNESLNTYPVRAPISGTIIQRHANTGEVTQDQVLFSIANFDTLWAEFRIYPSQQSLVNAGQSVLVDKVTDQFGDSVSQETQYLIQHIIPALDKPYQLARVAFDNRARGLSPGLLIEGHIVVGEFKVNLAVEKVAIQTLGEQQGVFVKNDIEYVFAPLRLGRADDRYVEVLSGLKPGQSYVSENSYLLKADIEKSEAEHAH